MIALGNEEAYKKCCLIFCPGENHLHLRELALIFAAAAVLSEFRHLIPEIDAMNSRVTCIKSAAPVFL